MISWEWRSINWTRKITCGNAFVNSLVVKKFDNSNLRMLLDGRTTRRNDLSDFSTAWSLSMASSVPEATTHRVCATTIVQGLLQKPTAISVSSKLADRLNPFRFAVVI
jgi:hypothetical protein